ncbi:MAG: DUF4329 domain-containing protein [Pseudohongiellaceae bacterium]
MILNSTAGLTGQENTAGISQEFYPSINAAVKAAADLYNPVSIIEDREFMGSILSFDDKFYFTVTAGQPGKDSVSIRIPKQLWQNVVAFWHTHGGAEPHHRFFSEVDTTLVNKLGLPFYLADFTGILKIYQPGDKVLSHREAARLGLPTQAGFAAGSTVFTDDRNIMRVRIRRKQENS